MYLRSAVPLNEALVTLGQHEKLPSFVRVIRQIVSDVENGQSLAHALSRFPRIFDRLYISLVEIGEASGTLPESLEHLAMFLERSYTLRKKVQSIFLYPSIVVLITFILGTFITVYILPQLVRLFSSFQITLPLSTRLLLGFSRLIEQYGWFFLFGAIILMLIVRLLFMFSLVRQWRDRIVLHIPFFGGFLRQYHIASFFHDLGVLLKSGVPVASALHIEKKSHQNTTFCSLAERLENALQEGKSLWQILETEYADLFPPIVAKMIAVGERSGKLEDTFFYLSKFFDEEVEQSIKNFTVLLEPVLLLLIGSMVAFIATAILAPIYSLTGSIRR